MSDSAESGIGPQGLRTLTGLPALVERGLLLAGALVGIAWMLDAPSYGGIAFFPEQFVALYWALMLAAVFVACPARKSGPLTRVPWYDWLLFALALATGLYTVVDYQRILMEMGSPTWDIWAPATVTLLLVFEATRRVTAPSLLWMLLAFIAYAMVAEHVPGLLRGNATRLDRLVIYLAYDSNGLLGSTLFIVATIVLAYMLFGTVLSHSGGARFFTDLAVAAMGRYRGGPAKVSVVGSTFFGSISGGAVTSVVTVGVITIPMMVRSGFRRESAAAIEAAASTGGQIMPPVMGTAAFMMAELLNIPYATIALAALIPALLFYVLLFVQVDLEAAKFGLRGLPAAEIPRAGGVFLRGWYFLLPIAALLFILFSLGFTAEKAALGAVVMSLIVAAFRKSTRPTPRRVMNMTIDTSRSMLELAVIGGLIAIMLGALNVSGLGLNIVNGLAALGGESTFLMLIVAAVLAFILGLGLPTIAVYLLLAVLLAPTIVKAGLDPLAVHLFLFYHGMMSMLSPPVAMAAFVAANIVNADPMKTGWISMRIGAIAFVVPFVFVYSPELLMKGSVPGIVWVTATTVVGGALFIAALIGFLYRDIGPGWRVAMFAAAVACFFPYAMLGGFGIAINTAGLAVVAAYALLQWRRGRAPAAAPTA